MDTDKTDSVDTMLESERRDDQEQAGNEHDFEGAERGKFYRPGVDVYTPESTQGAAHPPGFNPAHLPGLAHPADVVRAGSGLTPMPILEGMAKIAIGGLVAEMDRAAHEGDERLRSEGVQLNIDDTVELTPEQVVARDIARTQARAHQAAGDIMTAVAGVLIGSDAAHDGSYKRRVLTDTLVGMFMRGASFATALCAERLRRA